MPLLLLTTMLATAASSWSYEYPINDPYLATVMGTPKPLQADLPEDAKLKIRRLPKTTAWRRPKPCGIRNGWNIPIGCSADRHR